MCDPYPDRPPFVGASGKEWDYWGRDLPEPELEYRGRGARIDKQLTLTAQVLFSICAAIVLIGVVVALVVIA